MNTSELLEQAELALVRAKTELAIVDAPSCSEHEVWRRGYIRASTIEAIKRVLDVMQRTVAAVPVVLALAFGAGQAKAADQSAAIAKAEQAVVLATCKLNFLQQRPGAKKNDKEYFGFMFQCMSK